METLTCHECAEMDGLVVEYFEDGHDEDGHDDDDAPFDPAEEWELAMEGHK